MKLEELEAPEAQESRSRPPSRVKDATSFIWGAWKVRPRGRRAIWVLALLMAVSGAGMLTYPFLTNLYSSIRQSQLTKEFQSPEFESAFATGDIAPGQVLTRITIASIGVNALIVEGTEPAALRAGAGHYEQTALPCEPGNVGIAGHRTTYGKPFNQLDELRAGDIIELTTPTGSCKYRVVDGPAGSPRPRRGSPAWVTHPKDGAVLNPMDGHFLTLTTCHPKGSAAKRLIVRAELVG